MTYWEKRQQQLNKQLEKDEAKLKKRLSSFYDTEFKRLEKQIAAYYTEYGESNVIQYRKLMESLSDADKRLLIEQMDAFAEKYPQYADLIPVRASIYKLNRLEGLQYSVRMQQLQIGAVGIDELTKHLERNGFRAANAAAEALGFGKNFYAYNQDILKKFVGVSWSNGKNFSESIWQNTDKLAAYLNADMAHAFARGDAYQKIIRDLKSRFDKVSRNDMYRLIYTEGTYVMAEATMTPFECDFEQYRISTVGDERVCPICRGISGQIFEIKDRKPGENFPPFHPWCRCTFEIVVDDWDAWMEGYEQRHGNAQGEKIKSRLDPNNIVDVFHLNFPEEGATLEYEKMLLKAQTELEKYYQVTGIHSDGKNFYLRDFSGKVLERITPKRLAKEILDSEDYNGRPVKVYSCDAGAEGMTAAQELADSLGAPVKAPTSLLALTDDGEFRVFIKKKGRVFHMYDVDDGWAVFEPRR